MNINNSNVSDNQRSHRNSPLLIKVKFKGSKLALGTSRLASCVVENRFMRNLTDLNLLITGTNESKISKRVNERALDYSNINRNNVTTKRKFLSLETVNNSHKNKSQTIISNKNEEKHDKTFDANHVQDRNSTTGIISLKYDHCSVLDSSKYYPILQTNKRQFLRLIDSLDPIDFDVACDFDFWLWIDSQKYFAPFSYKTHNLNVLSLQDIGNKLDLNGCSKQLLLPSGGDTENYLIDENLAFQKNNIVETTKNPIQDKNGNRGLQHQYIDECISKLSKDLLLNNLEVNKIISVLRCKSLESSDIKLELENFTKDQEKDKIILTKWRKSNLDIMNNGNKLRYLSKKKRGIS